MKPKTWFSILMSLFIVSTLACSLRPQVTTVAPPPTNTPRPTATALPPRPVVAYTPVPADMLSPIVVQRAPRRGESMNPEGAIEIVFDKAMDQSAVAEAFSLQRAGETAKVNGKLLWVDEKTLRFEPTETLARDTAFDVILTQNAIAETGEPLREPYTFRFATAGTLEVTQVIPAPDTGDVETNATITVMFNRPVVPLSTLAQMETLPDPLSFEPEIKGSGEWLNTSVYVFTPEAPLAGGTTYIARVNAGLEDFGGARLVEDFTWQFTTLPPKVVWTNPRDGSTLVDINTPIVVEFNQAVDLASAREAFRMESGGLLPSRVGGDFAIEGNSLIFTPTKALAFDTTYTVVLDAGISSVAGGSGMKESYSWQFTTVPLPKIVATRPEHLERRAPPYTAFEIIFNTPIDPDTVMANLTMTPPFTPTEVYTSFSRYNNTFVLDFGARPSTEYTVVIDDGIADPYGNTIPKGRTVKFRTAPLPPTYQLRVPDMVGTYDAALPAQVVIGHVNLNRVDLELYKIPISAYIERFWRYWDDETLPQEQMLRAWRENLESPMNKQAYTAIDLTESGGPLEPGCYILTVEAPDLDKDDYQRQQRHILMVSDINLTLKTGPEVSLAWATDLATGTPLANLPLTFVALNESTLDTINTDGDGIAQMPLSYDHSNILVYSENPFAAISEGWGRGISPWDFGVGEGMYEEAYRTYIYSDRPIYRPGQTVNFKGVIRAENDVAFSLPGLREVRVIVRDAAYDEIFNETRPLSDLGTFDGSVDLEEGASLGQYFIAVEVGDTYAQQMFQVAAYRPPEFEVTLDTPLSEVQRGDDVEATIAVNYLFGAPLANTDVTWNVLSGRYRFKPPWGGRYSFDDVNDPYICFDCWWWPQPPTPSEPILSGTGTTDANGELHITLSGEDLKAALAQYNEDAPKPVPLSQAGDESSDSTFEPTQITIEATATGPDNQVIAGRTSVVVHPGPYYIGLSPQEYVSDAGEESNIDLVAVDWEGGRLPDKEILVTFYQREWINTFIERASGGGFWSWETEETKVADVTVTTDALGEAVATFIPPEGGSYHIVATPANPTPETEGIRSSIFIWVAGEDNVSWRRENHDRITLISDKNSYQVGETAEILIPAPFEGPYTALVTIERAGIRRHDVVRLESNSAIYRLPITEGDVPNIYVSVALVKGRAESGQGSSLAGFKMGLLPLDVSLETVTLDVALETDVTQAAPGDEVTYTITAKKSNGEPVAGAELSVDMVDKAVLNLQPRSSNILQQLYARRALQVRTASGLNISVNRYLEELAEDLELELVAAQNAREFEAITSELAEEEGAADMDFAAPEAPAAMPTATAAAEKSAGGGLPPGIEIRETFADTALWTPVLVTDGTGRAEVTVTLPDNLTTWVLRGVGLTAETIVGEGNAELVATKPLLIRPVAPRFFVVDDRAQLAANVSNNTDQPLEVEVGLSSEGISLSPETPSQQTVTIPARSETKVTWRVTVEDVTQATLIFSAVSGEYADASKPRLTTGPDGSLMVLRYTAPDIVGTAGQLIEAGSRTEAIALPPYAFPSDGTSVEGGIDDRRGKLTVQLDPSLAAGMRAGLDYLEHYEYECTEQTVSRFLPNVLTYNALQSLGIENPELAERLPDLVQEGLTKLYNQQNPDGGWGWWPSRPEDARWGNWTSNAHVSGYVVFALLKAQQSGWSVRQDVLDQGIAYLQSQLKDVRDYKNMRNANQQAWLLYVLAEGNSAPKNTLDALHENRDKLSYYARAYLAQALWIGNTNDTRIETLLSDLNNAALLSATGAHWEESDYDWWAMNTDTRSTAIILDTLAKLDPQNALIPNVVRWLMVAREVGIWETTQETAWALIALTDWMLETGELDASYDYALYLNDVERTQESVSRDTVEESTQVVIPIAELVADATNALTIARTDGNGRLYYTAHLEVYLPVEQIEAADRGFIVQRRYTLAACEAQRAEDADAELCPEVREVKLGDVIRVDLTIIAPHDRYYVVVEDPLPAGGEAIDTGLATTSLLAMDPQLRREGSRYWWWWRWYSRSELRDEKVVLFADYLPAGTYEYSYTFRATLPGDYHVIPTLAQEFYFPEVFGRSDGRLLTIGE